MESFVEFLLLEKRPAMAATGVVAKRHKKQYIDPHIGSTDYTHATFSNIGDIAPETPVRIHSARVVGGKTLVTIQAKGSKSKLEVPASKISKPGAIPQNKGADYEQTIASKFKKHKMSSGQTAGFTAGSDFTASSPDGSRKYNGETKLGKTAAFGQITIRYHPDKGGWHIPDDNRGNRPQYADEVEKIHVNGVPLLQHMNQHHHPDMKLPKGLTRAPNIMIDHPNLEPAEKYFSDHHVDMVQIGRHGAYAAGKKDRTGFGLPRMSGTGQWRVRQKTDASNARTVQFMVKKLDKSNINFENDEHVKQFAKHLGH